VRGPGWTFAASARAGPFREAWMIRSLPRGALVIPRYTPVMPRKQVGAIDADLLAEVDKRAEWLGQTRRVFIERTLRDRLANPDWKLSGPQGFVNPVPASEARPPR
jgi:Arc/MetJ family transcription regulator